MRQSIFPFPPINNKSRLDVSDIARLALGGAMAGNQATPHQPDLLGRRTKAIAKHEVVGLASDPTARLCLFSRTTRYQSTTVPMKPHGAISDCVEIEVGTPALWSSHCRTPSFVNHRERPPESPSTHMYLMALT